MKKFWVVLFTILDLGAIFCLLLAYGPSTKFKNWFILTSNDSWTHAYLAKVLYSEETIQEVLNSNEFIETNEVMDPTAITFNNEDTGEYESIYDEQVLKRDEGNDVYKIINITGDDYTGYVVCVYDSKRINLVLSSKYGNRYGSGLSLGKIAEENDALLAVNASGFNYSNNVMQVDMTAIVDGKLIYDNGTEIIGFDSDGVLRLINATGNEAIEQGIVDGVSFGPFLIVNGVSSQASGGGLRPRTAIGQRKDGTVLFVVINGNTTGTKGADMEDLIEIFETYGAYNAANLDGGGSSTLWANGKNINTPCGWGQYYKEGRALPNAWIIK